MNPLLKNWGKTIWTSWFLFAAIFSDNPNLDLLDRFYAISIAFLPPTTIWLCDMKQIAHKYLWALISIFPVAGFSLFLFVKWNQVTKTNRLIEAEQEEKDKTDPHVATMLRYISDLKKGVAPEALDQPIPFVIDATDSFLWFSSHVQTYATRTFFGLHHAANLGFCQVCISKKNFFIKAPNERVSRFHRENLAAVRPLADGAELNFVHVRPIFVRIPDQNERRAFLAAVKFALK